MTLRDSQARVDAWISQFEEGYFPPLTNMARLSEEVGELAREINHRFGQKTKKKDEPEGDTRHGDGRHPVRDHLHGEPGRDRSAGSVRPDDGEGRAPGHDALDQKGR